MPLPSSMHILNGNSEEQKVTFAPPKRDVGFTPTPDFNPTRKVVCCSICKTTGIAEFISGFDLVAADALMAGKPISGICYRCQKTVELIPLAITGEQLKEYLTQYEIQRTLDEYTARRWPVPSNGSLIPIGKLKEYERQGRLPPSGA
jgi:hypothetical protein